MKITKKIIHNPCYVCSPVGGKALRRKKCKTCKRSGHYKDYYYIIQFGKQAIMVDTLK